MCDLTNKIYINSQQIIYGLQLFNYDIDYSTTNNTNNGEYKVILNLLINKYMNFNQFNIVANLINNYDESNNLIVDNNNLKLNLHKKFLFKRYCILRCL